MRGGVIPGDNLLASGPPIDLRVSTTLIKSVRIQKSPLLRIVVIVDIASGGTAYSRLQNFQLRSRDRFIQHQNRPPVTVTITIDTTTSARLFNKSIMLPHRECFIVRKG